MAILLFEIAVPRGKGHPLRNDLHYISRLNSLNKSLQQKVVQNNRRGIPQRDKAIRKQPSKTLYCRTDKAITLAL